MRAIVKARHTSEIVMLQLEAVGGLQVLKFGVSATEEKCEDEAIQWSD